MKTKATGETVLTVDARVKRPRKFNLRSMFGLGFGIGYGPRLSKSESFVAMWAYQNDKQAFDWGAMSSRGDMSLDEVRMEPKKAQAEAIDEQGVWKALEMKLLGKKLTSKRKNKLKIVAERPFRISDDRSRDLKVGTIRKWAIGFFDIQGAGAFSEVMDLHLDNGCLEEELKPAHVEGFTDQEENEENGSSSELTPVQTETKPKERTRKDFESEMAMKIYNQADKLEEDRYYEDWYYKFKPKDGQHPDMYYQRKNADGSY